MIFLRFFENFEFFMENSPDDIPMLLARPVSSTIPPGGNQVDGLPPAPSAETVAKPGRLWPAQNDESMQNFIELTMFRSMVEGKTPRSVVRNLLNI